MTHREPRLIQPSQRSNVDLLLVAYQGAVPYSKWTFDQPQYGKVFNSLLRFQQESLFHYLAENIPIFAVGNGLPALITGLKEQNLFTAWQGKPTVKDIQLDEIWQDRLETPAINYKALLYSSYTPSLLTSFEAVAECNQITHVMHYTRRIAGTMCEPAFYKDDQNLIYGDAVSLELLKYIITIP